MFHALAKSLLVYFPETKKYLTKAKGVLKMIDINKKSPVKTKTSIYLLSLIYKLKELETISDTEIHFGTHSFNSYDLSLNWDDVLIGLTYDMKELPIGVFKFLAIFPYKIYLQRVDDNRIDFFITFMYDALCHFLLS